MGAFKAVSVRSAGLLATVAAAAAIVAVAVVAPPFASAKRVRNGLIAYVTGNGEEEPFAIWTVKPDGTRNRRLLHADRRFQSGPSGPRWSRDGGKLLFFRGVNRDSPSSGSLWYLTVATHRLKRVPLPADRGFIRGYDWAPDGRHVVVSLARDYDKSMLYTLRLDGTHRKRLRPGLSPSWSGDGRHIVFTLMRHRSARPWASTVNVVRPNGTGFRRLSAPSADSDWMPSFSPGGTVVLYLRNAPSVEWRTVDVTGRDDKLVRTPETPSGITYGCLQWTPDGRRLAALRTEPLTALGADGPLATALVTFTRSARSERKLFTFPSNGVGCFSWQRAP